MTNLKESDNMSAQCKKVDEALISVPEFIIISPLEKKVEVSQKARESTKLISNDIVDKMSFRCGTFDEALIFDADFENINFHFPVEYHKEIEQQLSNTRQIIDSVPFFESESDIERNAFHFPKVCHEEFEEQLSNAEGFGNKSENEDDKVVDLHLFSSSCFQQDEVSPDKVELIKKKMDRTKLRIHLLMRDSSLLLDSFKSITIEYCSLPERIQEDFKCSKPSIVLFINNGQSGDITENGIVALHGSQEGKMSPKKEMDDHTCIMRVLTLAFDDGGKKDKKSCAEEIYSKKERSWMAGMTKPLTRKMTYNFGGRGHFMVLLLFLFISIACSKCILKKKATTLDMTCTTLSMEVSYSKGCNGKSYRWDWNKQHIYFGSSNEKIGPKYIFQHDLNSSCVRAIIKNITSDDWRGQYLFTTNYKTIKFVLSNQTIIANGKWEVRCQDKEIVYNTTVKHTGENISLAAYLRSANGTNFSQMLDVKVLTTEWNDVMFSSQVMFNGKGGIGIDGLNLDIEVDKEPHFSEPVEVNLTHSFLTKCKGSKAIAKVTGNHLAITIGLSIGITIVVAVFLSIIGWFCLKRKMGTSFVSRFYSCKRDDQDGRNGEEGEKKNIRLLDI